MVNQAGRYWRFDYRFGGKRKTLSIGVFPDVQLADAREKHQQARSELANNNVDPADRFSKRAKVKAQRILVNNTLKSVCEEWLALQQSKWADSHYRKVELRLTRNVYPVLGAREISSIKLKELHECLELVEKRGAIDSAHRIRQVLGQVFAYAEITERIDYDPTPKLKGVLNSVTKRNYPHITNPARLGEVLRMIDGYDGSIDVGQALRLLWSIYFLLTLKIIGQNMTSLKRRLI